MKFICLFLLSFPYLKEYIGRLHLEKWPSISSFEDDKSCVFLKFSEILSESKCNHLQFD
jgi:hypothetical protein